MNKKNTMNLFELYDYIEALEKRIIKLEQYLVGNKKKEYWEEKPPFYYQKDKGEKQ